MPAGGRTPGTSPGVRDTAGVTTSREALVGRDEELAFLRDRLGRARSGAGRLVLVCGPAGIGKTRLVEELVADGTEVAWGAAVDDPGMPALWPWTRALRGLPNASAAVASVITGGRESGSAEDAAAATFAADTAVVDALDEHASAAGGLLMASVAYLMDLVPALGDAAQCRLLRDTVEVLVGEMLVVGTGTVFYQGSMARVMGELNLGAGEPAVAIPRFEEGIRVDGLLATGDLARATELARSAARRRHPAHRGHGEGKGRRSADPT